MANNGGVEGSYMTSFFELYVESKHMDFNTGEFHHLSVFVHEFVHFLQDLMTNYGHYGIFNYGEYISLVINNIMDERSKGYDEFHFPFVIKDNSANVLLNLEVRKLTIGTKLSDKDANKGKVVMLLDVVKEKRKVGVPNTEGLDEIEVVVMKCQNGLEFEFGSDALTESMAYICERTATKNALSSPDFPYSAAEMIANHIAPDFAKDILNVLALCDMALLFSSNPGVEFYDFLMTYRNKKWNAKYPEVIIDQYYKWHEPHWKNLLTHFVYARRKLLNYIKKDSPEYTQTVKDLTRKALYYRLKKRYIFLDLARGCNPKDGTNPILMQLISDFKSPALRNENYEYFTFGHDEFAMQMLAIRNVVRLFEEGADVCELYDWCTYTMKNKPENGIVVDDRCWQNPWTRCHDEPLCPYGHIWKHWNLRQTKPIV